MKIKMKSIRLYLKMICEIDRKSVVVCILYHLIKQLLNVFYGVYFLRLILVHIETDQDMRAISGVLLFMMVINVIYYFGNQYFKTVYMPVFETRLQQRMDEIIAEKAASLPYDEYNCPDFLNLYKRLLDNTAPNMIKVLESVGTIFGLAEAFALIIFYIGRIDCFAIVLAVVPLFYSYVVGAKAAKYRMELNRELAAPARKKEYAKRVFYLPEYAKELKTTSVSGVVIKIFDEGANETIRFCRKFGKKIGLVNFIEMLIGDVLIIMLPIVYVMTRILIGHSLLIGDFIGIAQSITIFGWDIEWCFFEIKKIK